MNSEPRKYVLLTGADLGDRQFTLQNAAEMVERSIGSIIDRSETIETKPWGFESETMFLNQALLVETHLPPAQVLSKILEIEQSLGRKRHDRQWTSRKIDIDILCSENEIHHSDELTIPHKHLHQRSFALRPLCQLVPSWTHPLLGKTYHQLLTELESDGMIASQKS